MITNQIEELNIDYYEKLYKKKYSIIALLHSLVSYDQQSKSKRNYFYLKSILNAYQRRNKKVKYLDYGCGHGSLLLKMNSSMELYAADISSNSLRNLSNIAGLLKKNIKTISIEEFMANNQGKRFDIISCSHVLEHVINDRELLKTFHMNLEDGGTLLLNLPINEVWQDPKHVHNYSEITAENMLDKAGFTVKEIFLTDRLTGWFIKHEQKGIATTFKNIIFRMMRLFFGIMPLSVLFLFDRITPKRFPFQQLIIIAEK
ncbi:MAG: class I SAM-dependent methyltransferase [Ignavibacteriales bacterium]|nr:class I SAM-dependent methyltransferase [Ignavibacteriales bacterium]